MSSGGGTTLIWHGPRVTQALRTAALRGVRKASAQAQKDVRAQLRPPPKRTGRIYRIRTINARFRKHQASAPGESPARLTGNLIRSVHRQTRRTGRDQATAEIEVKADYGLRLQKGIGVRKRPFLDVAMKKHAPKWVGIVTAEITPNIGFVDSSNMTIT